MKNHASASARSILATLALGAGLAIAVVGCSSTSSDRAGSAGDGTTTQSETMTAAPGSMVTPMMTTAPMTTTAPMMTTAPAP